MNSGYKRGLLIVFEGMDRVGKSTQCELLAEYFKNIRKENVERINFPDRTTPSGNQLNDMLKAVRNMNLRASHLLFSFNRWEKKEDIISILNSGTNLIVDRYAFSGYCYSVCNGLDKQWALIPDQTLPRPDIVFQLDADDKLIVNRENYGEEIYEKHEFQKKLRQEYKFFHSYKYWRVIDALRPKEEVSKDIITEVENLILKYESKEISEFEKNDYPSSIREDLFSVVGFV